MDRKTIETQDEGSTSSGATKDLIVIRQETDGRIKFVSNLETGQAEKLLYDFYMQLHKSNLTREIVAELKRTKIITPGMLR